MHYTLRQLEVFVAVAQHESVSHAARALAMSQSATSTALAELERQFDCQLLDRIGKRLKLNALGFQLLPKAVALLDRAEEVEELLRGQQGVGALDVGATLTIGNYLATLLISDFMQRYPGSRVRLAVRNTRHIIEGVRQHSLDLGLIEGQCEEDEVITQPWVEDDLVVFCSPRHPLANRGLRLSGLRLLFAKSLPAIIKPVFINQRHGVFYGEYFFPVRLKCKLDHV